MRLFDKMVTMLLYKLKVRSCSGYLNLLRVVKGPITDHIPTNTRLIRVEKDGVLTDPFDLPLRYGSLSLDAASKVVGDSDTTADRLAIKAAMKGQFAPFAFVVGGMSRGDVDVDYAQKGRVDCIRFGDRGMSAAAVCSLIAHAYEEAWIACDD
jgi:rRNA small subunit pseudouridine methyltransferase Nep1